MSNARRIIKGKDDKNKKNKTTISQSIPVDFYKNYIPPKTPKINPMQPPAIPDFDKLPKISPSAKKTTYSLTNKYPMSMPVRSGFMGPNTTPFVVSNPSQASKDEEKNEPNSLLRTDCVRICAFILPYIAISHIQRGRNEETDCGQLYMF